MPPCSLQFVEKHSLTHLLGGPRLDSYDGFPDTSVLCGCFKFLSCQKQKKNVKLVIIDTLYDPQASYSRYNYKLAVTSMQMLLEALSKHV